MRVITGDECGILKECVPELAKVKKQDSQVPDDPSKVVLKDTGNMRIDKETVARNQGFMDLTWIDKTDDKSFASLRWNGTVQIWERSSMEPQSFGQYRQTARFSVLSDHANPTSAPFAMKSFHVHHKHHLCICNGEGTVQVLNPSWDDPVVETFDAFESKSKDPLYPTISAMTVHEQSKHVAVGGKDRETVIFDLQTAKLLWKAKNLPPNRQTLLQPLVWPSSLLFMQKSFLSDGNILAMGSAHKEVRIYDVQASRKPVLVTPKGFFDHRVMAMCQINDHQLVVGDSAGYLTTVDLRKLDREGKTAVTTAAQGRYIGPSGSIRQLVKHETLDRIAVVGLDRMLRIYETTTRKQLSCMYLKQRLSTCLFGEEGHWGEDGEDFDDHDIDQDDLVRDYVDSDAESEKDDDEENEDSSSETDSQGSQSSSSGEGGESDQDKGHQEPKRRRKQ